MNLKPVEIGILVLSPRTGSTEWNGDEQKLAHRLVKRGYLSLNIEKQNVFQCTPEGEKALSEVFRPHGLSA